MVRPQTRPRIRRRRGRWLALLSGAALALLAATACADPAPAVILISLDGTPPGSVAGLPTFDHLRAGGASAEQLVPVFPTNTFPNHVSLVTGVAPERHGIVGNRFLDPERGLFDYASDPTWIEVAPLWSLAERHGVPTASFHWVGSEGAWRDGRGPRRWQPFDPDTPEREKVDRILAWLALPDPGERPRLITAWFHGGDHAGHRYGPDSPELRAALREQDAQLGRLLRALEARAAFAYTTLLVVSDHGMRAVADSVDLDGALREAGIAAQRFGGGGSAIVVLREPDAVARAVAVARSLGLEAHARGAAPADLRLDHPRFGDLVAIAPAGVVIASGRTDVPAMRGAHGYRPEMAGMGALFLAFGRAVPAGVRLGAVRTVDVAPTVLALLGIPIPEWMEGRPIAPLAAAPAAAPGAGGER